MSITFRMTGNACGSCSHKHFSVVAAAKCACRFEYACDDVGKYSDRQLVAIEDNVIRRATLNEQHQFAFAYDVEKALRESKKSIPFRVQL